MTLIDAARIPDHPLASVCRPEVYRTFADFIASPDIRGIGANVRDIEILRLACLEKRHRDGLDGRIDTGFRLNFLAHIQAPWATDLVTFWDEGLGVGWNLLVVDGAAIDLLERVLFRRYPTIFALFNLPARLPGYACDFSSDYTICRYHSDTPPLTDHERALWQDHADLRNLARRRGGSNAINWGT
jgi:hypothetical protein